MNQAIPSPRCRPGVKLPRCSCDASSRSAPDECKDFVADGIHRVPAGCFDVEAEQSSALEGRRLNQAGITQGDGQDVEPVGANPRLGPGGFDLVQFGRHVIDVAVDLPGGDVPGVTAGQPGLRGRSWR
jgi:hypothetical protein